jgi:hypothetical protein
MPTSYTGEMSRIIIAVCLTLFWFNKSTHLHDIQLLARQQLQTYLLLLPSFRVNDMSLQNNMKVRQLSPTTQQ